MAIDLRRPTIVATLRTEFEAALVANFLVSEGIEARIAGSSSRGGYSACQLEIQVAGRENDLERARTLLADNRPAAPRQVFHLGLRTWCYLVAMPALLFVTQTPFPVWPTLMLFGFVGWEGFWRLMTRRRETSPTDDE